MRRCFSSSKLSKAIHAVCISLGALGVSSSAHAGMIISTNFVSGGSNDSLDGTQIGLTTNLPGGNWIWGAGWNWSAPLVNATWMGGTLQNAASFGEEKSALGISLASEGTYTKPATIHVSALVETTDSGHPNGRNGLGFWATIPARSDSEVSFTGFTGVSFKADGTLAVIENGVAGATASVSALAYSTLYSLSYDVDTTTGSLSNVVFNGSSVSLSTTAFTSAATTYVGYATDTGSRGGFTTFEVSSVPEPASLSILVLGGAALITRRKAMDVNPA